MVRFAISQYPDVGGDAGVVEEIQGQCNDGFQPVVLDDPATDVALALAGVAGEERAAVVYFGEAAAEFGAVLHLGQQVGKEQHLAVAGAGNERIFRIAGMRDDEARIFHAVLAAHAFEVALPALAIGRIGEHEIEFARGEGVAGQGGMLGAADDVVRRVTLALQQQVGLANGIGLGVDLLAIEMGGDLFAMVGGQLLQGFLGNGQHATRAAGAVIE